MFDKIYYIRTKIQTATKLKNQKILLSQLRAIVEDAVFQRVEQKEIETKLTLFTEMAEIDLFLSGTNFEQV